MMVILQRVKEASVSIANQVCSAIGPGLLLLVCAEPGDDEKKIRKMAAKVAKLRIFSDSDGKMNLSVKDVGGEVLAVSQFTLAADVWSGNRPSFTRAAGPSEGLAVYEAFVAALTAEGLQPKTGQFGAHMQIALLNDGPVTIPMRL
ncbi:D-tyrosyl-tRNA(Tyr) deacylase [gut metagenome]|uniref:D-tyrosyl-tRNA(Tyr) deacylase n=1 Tax=gut metagenome TaxID=749906 RepID=J9GFA3_9ZZZZ